MCVELNVLDVESEVFNGNYSEMIRCSIIRWLDDILKYEGVHHGLTLIGNALTGADIDDYKIIHRIIDYLPNSTDIQ